ncbi:MAG: hypothetical protein JSR19_01400 [Proteobacteria bacterium]|nr:hypothetical protein [Pseudomonadota bacterium]HQR02505.1 hypothetical protein [Rhodocyclaceae bacterium]
MQVTRNVAIKYGLGLGLAASAASSFAAGIDLTPLTSAIDLTTVVAAIMAVAALKFAPQLTKFAVNSISKMFPK